MKITLAFQVTIKIRNPGADRYHRTSQTNEKAGGTNLKVHKHAAAFELVLIRARCQFSGPGPHIGPRRGGGCRAGSERRRGHLAQGRTGENERPAAEEQRQAGELSGDLACLRTRMCCTPKVDRQKQLEHVMAMRIVTYNFLTEKGATRKIRRLKVVRKIKKRRKIRKIDQKNSHMGLVAQEVQAIDPDAVVHNGKYLGVKQVLLIVDFLRQNISWINMLMTGHGALQDDSCRAASGAPDRSTHARSESGCSRERTQVQLKRVHLCEQVDSALQKSI